MRVMITRKTIKIRAYLEKAEILIRFFVALGMQSYPKC